jgi:hypothetical protein
LPVTLPQSSTSASGTASRTTSGTASAPTSTNSSGASNTLSSQPTASASSSGLSSGAKAGIGAGVGLAALIALVLLGLFFFRRRKQRAAPSADEPNPYAKEYFDASAPGTATKYGHVGVSEKVELDSNAQRAELPSPPPAELFGGEVPRQELSGAETHKDVKAGIRP